MKTRLLSIFALLLMSATGTWAQNTYNVTLADGTDDAANWSIDPTTATAGETVTIKYNGTKTVNSIKVVKKEVAATARTLSEATTADLGKIVGADGNIYDTKDAAVTAGTTAVAMIAYVGSSKGHPIYTHGLAIALADESDSNWTTANSTCEGKSAVTNAAWLLPSRNQWEAMFKAFGGNEGQYSGLNTAITNAGGTGLYDNDILTYWSSSPLVENFLHVRLKNGVATWPSDSKYINCHVRACLAF